MVPSRAVPSRSLPPLFMGSPRLRAPARAHPAGGGAGLERGGGGGAGGCPLPPLGPGTARHGWGGSALPVRLGDPVPLGALGSRTPHSAPRTFGAPQTFGASQETPPALCSPGSGTPGGHPMDTLSIGHPKAGVPIGAPWGRTWSPSGTPRQAPHRGTLGTCFASGWSCSALGCCVPPQQDWDTAGSEHSSPRGAKL